MLPWRVAIIVAAVVIAVDGRGDDGDAVSDGACGNDTSGHAYYACLYPFELPQCDDVPGEYVLACVFVWSVNFD